MSRSPKTHSRGETEIAKDLLVMSSMYLQGYKMAEIAEKLGLSVPTVSKDLKKVREEWKRSALVDMNEAKNRELSRIDTLEIEYWEAWRRSQKNAETRTTKTSDESIEETFREEGQVGNPAFLAGIQWCISKRCDILGLDAPNRSVNLNFDNLSIQQLERLAAGEDVVTVLAG